jgi:hypothetical protein
MNLSTTALVFGGALGCIVGVIHGVLLRSRMTGPLHALAIDSRAVSRPIQRLIVPLMQFSTFAWITSGIALIFAALWLPTPAKVIVSFIVGSQYLYGAVFNLAATRRAHPGWILMTLALAAITLGILTDPDVSSRS